MPAENSFNDMSLNPFSPNQKVVCISDRFKYAPEYGGSPFNAVRKPVLNEILQVYGVLGEFLTFEKYNNQNGVPNAINWFHYGHFAPISTDNRLKYVPQKIEHFDPVLS